MDTSTTIGDEIEEGKASIYDRDGLSVVEFKDGQWRL